MVEQLQELTQGLKKLEKSELRNLLLGIKRFRRYSLVNQYLILSQMPSAKSIAGFKEWQERGRQVRKGEKSLRILAPRIVKDKKTDEKKVIGFFPVAVFDIQQTDGPEIEELQQTKKDNVAVDEEHFRAMLRVFSDENIHYEEKELEDDHFGYCQNCGGRLFITVNSKLENLEKLATMIHEYAHALLHMNKEDRPSLTIREIEAEGVTFAVLGSLGYETAVLEDNMHYIFTYAVENPDISKQLETIKKTALAIVDKLEVK